jgi:prepilin-type N-terminal cleavage/methylation domain-containing protein
MKLESKLKLTEEEKKGNFSLFEPRKKSYSRASFTLIELLVVIAIIGILSGLILAGMNGATQSATMAKSKVFATSLRDSLGANLISQWSLDDASGTTATDSWSGGNNGTLYNFASTAAGYGDSNSDGWNSSKNCVSNTCLEFDGTDDYVAVPGSDSTSSNLAITGAITLSAWVKLNASGVYQYIAGRGQAFAGNGNYGYALAYNGTYNQLWWGMHSTTVFNEIYSSSAYTDNNWHLVVGTWDGTTNSNGMKFYIDGRLDGQKTATISAIGQPAYQFRIGSKGSSGYYLNGSIDDVRVFNAAIPTSQIQEQYYAGLKSLYAKGEITESEYSSRIGE